MRSRANSYEGLKKVELEAALDDYLAEHTDRLSGRSDLQGYYNSRSKALGSPVKRETVKDEAEKAVKVAKKRASKVAEEVVAEYVQSFKLQLQPTPRLAMFCDAMRRVYPCERAGCHSPSARV
jgi:hypothetical protein